MYALQKSAVQFTLHLRCDGCLKESVRVVDAPLADDAPADVDELLESEFLAGMSYSCSRCECRIGRLVAANARYL
jgi:hypothetical protein